MAFNERLEIVELNAANEAVSLLNLNDGVHYMMEAGTFEPLPPEPTAVLSEDQRRYGGARQVGEVHATNGSIEWVAGVTAVTEQAALEKVEALLAQLAANPYHSYVLWQVPGASYPTLYEMRGTGTWQPKYSVATLEGAQLFLFQVHVPVAPLAQGLPEVVYEHSGETLPETIALGTISGDAPALAEVSIETGGEPDYAFITGAHNPAGIALNSTYIYFCNEATGYIGRALLAGTSVEETWLHVEGTPASIAVDGTYIYWGSTGGDIGRAKLAGSSIEKAWITTTGGYTITGLAVSASFVYWAANASVGRATIAGTEKKEAFVTASSPIWGVAVNSSRLYVTLPGRNALGYAPIAGGTLTEIPIAGASEPRALAIDSTYLYWTGKATGTIGRIALLGSEVAAAWISGVGTSPEGIAVNGQHVFWSEFEENQIGRSSVNTDPPIWALLGWAPKPTTGLAESPFGLLRSFYATGFQNLEYEAVAGALGLPAGPGQALAADTPLVGCYWKVDPATLTPDSFTNEVSLEVWARVQLEAGMTTANLTLSAQPQDGSGYGAPRYTDEWGSAGRPEVLPSSGTAWRFTRLGTIHMLVNPLAPRIWKLVLEGASEVAGHWAVDYLVCVPSLQRACSPSSKPNNAAYPPFIANVGPTVKTVRSNLSAVIARATPTFTLKGKLTSGSAEVHIEVKEEIATYPEKGMTVEGTGIPTGTTILTVGLGVLTLSQPVTTTAEETLTLSIERNGHPDHGLGGQLMQIPSGESELVCKLSSLVPDSPEVNASTEQTSHEAKVTVTVTPRWFLARTS